MSPRTIITATTVLVVRIAVWSRFLSPSIFLTSCSDSTSASLKASNADGGGQLRELSVSEPAPTDGGIKEQGAGHEVWAQYRPSEQHREIIRRGWSLKEPVMTEVLLEALAETGPDLRFPNIAEPIWIAESGLIVNRDQRLLYSHPFFRTKQSRGEQDEDDQAAATMEPKP